jgi:hypothetical protein
MVNHSLVSFENFKKDEMENYSGEYINHSKCLLQHETVESKMQDTVIGFLLENELTKFIPYPEWF